MVHRSQTTSERPCSLSSKTGKTKMKNPMQRDDGSMMTYKEYRAKERAAQNQKIREQRQQPRDAFAAQPKAKRESYAEMRSRMAAEKRGRIEAEIHQQRTAKPVDAGPINAAEKIIELAP